MHILALQFSVWHVLLQTAKEPLFGIPAFFLLVCFVTWKPLRDYRQARKRGVPEKKIRQLRKTVLVSSCLLVLSLFLNGLLAWMLWGNYRDISSLRQLEPSDVKSIQIYRPSFHVPRLSNLGPQQFIGCITDKIAIRKGLEKLTFAKEYSQSPGDFDYVLRLIREKEKDRDDLRQIFLLVGTRDRNNGAVPAVSLRVRPLPGSDFPAYYNDDFVKWVRDQVKRTTATGDKGSTLP